MGIRFYKPTSPGRRFASVSDFSELTDKNKKPENCLPMTKIPTGLQIHNIEMVPGGGAKLCRSAGVFAMLTAREGSWAQITLPSGEVRRIPPACRATIGAVGNADHMKIRLGKAGRKRWLGRRPHVRGTRSTTRWAAARADQRATRPAGQPASWPREARPAADGNRPMP